MASRFAPLHLFWPARDLGFDDLLPHESTKLILDDLKARCERVTDGVSKQMVKSRDRLRVGLVEGLTNPKRAHQQLSLTKLGFKQVADSGKVLGLAQESSRGANSAHDRNHLLRPGIKRVG